MRDIHLYRTPTSLRAYTQVFLNSFPVLFAPYFANLSWTAEHFDAAGHLVSEHYDLAGYVVAILYSLVLVGLDNIQEDLEHPYDRVGEDDLQLNVAELYGRLLALD